jgi:hypothetical protein
MSGRKILTTSLRLPSTLSRTKTFPDHSVHKRVFDPAQEPILSVPWNRRQTPKLAPLREAKTKAV